MASTAFMLFLFNSFQINSLKSDEIQIFKWQTALKLLAGQEEELFRLIPILLGCPIDAVSEESFIEVKTAKKVRRLVEENA